MWLYAPATWACPGLSYFLSFALNVAPFCPTLFHLCLLKSSSCQILASSWSFSYSFYQQLSFASDLQDANNILPYIKGIWTRSPFPVQEHTESQKAMTCPVLDSWPWLSGTQYVWGTMLNLIPIYTHAVYFSISLWTHECTTFFTHWCLCICCSL